MDAFEDTISMKIEYRLIELESATDILRFSFIAQNSISPLDLAQQERSSMFHHYHILGFRTNSMLDSTIQYPKYLINTEEKCRKILSLSRSFLYRFHLDLPKKREYSLKDGPELKNMQPDCFRRHIGKITAHPNFHFTLLSSLVKEAIHRNGKKLKMIKWLVTFNAVTEDARLDTGHARYFAWCMYPEVIDSAFVRAFLKKLDLDMWIYLTDLPAFLEFLFFHLRQNGSTLEGNSNFRQGPMEMSIMGFHFLNVATILKFQDAPRLPTRATVWSIYTLREDRGRPSWGVLREAEKRMSPKRFYLLMQFFYIFFTQPAAFKVECLRLLWHSLPDAFFSFKEIETVLQADVSPEAIRDIYNFYSGAVGVIDERAVPRSLKHLSRPAVRRMLWDSGCWIPDGIKLTGVPKELQLFLNLEA